MHPNQPQLCQFDKCPQVVDFAADLAHTTFVQTKSFMTFAIYSKNNNVVRVHYSHLTEEQAQNEVDRLNANCYYYGHPSVYWCEQHHPEHEFVIG